MRGSVAITIGQLVPDTDTTAPVPRMHYVAGLVDFWPSFFGARCLTPSQKTGHRNAEIPKATRGQYKRAIGRERLREREREIYIYIYI